MVVRVRRALLAPALLLGPPVTPAAHASHEAVTVERPTPYYASTDSIDFVVLVACRARATEDANWTMVRCELDGSQTVLFMPDESPMGAGEPVWNFSSTTVSGPVAVAVWEGGAKAPMEVCAYAEAGFNQPDGGPPLVVSDGPECTTIEA